MPIPHRLSLKLHEIFGNEAAGAMADWMNGIEGGQSELRADMAELRHAMNVQFAQAREELRVGLAEVRGELRASIAELREEMHTSIAGLRDEMHTSLGDTRQEMGTNATSLREEMRDLREEMRAGFLAGDAKLAAAKVDIMKWAFGFWIASLTMLAALLAIFVRFSR